MRDPDPSNPDLVGDSMLFPNLPDDLSVQCIARVPRSSHPSLVLVSRSWRSLLRSRRLFSLRADLGVTEPSLCVDTCTVSGGFRWHSRWYFLNFLNLRPCSFLPFPPPPFPTSRAACAVLGSSLYVLGGFDERTSMPSSAVQIFDPCLNRWTTGPPMAEARRFPFASVSEGRIYVFGRFDRGSVLSAEVLDPESGVWASLPSRPARFPNWSRFSSYVFRGQLLLDQGFLLDPEVAQLQGVVLEVPRDDWIGPEVVLDGVLYVYNSKGKLGGYDPTAGVWKPVEGVEGELPEDFHCAVLTNVGGLLCLVCVQGITKEERSMEPSMPEITPDMHIQYEMHCVGVEITRTGSGGFSGSVAWHEAFGMPNHGPVMHAVVLEF